ncbi:hypothetical protein M9458_018894, partial [Cirrhinus mrigala]
MKCTARVKVEGKEVNCLLDTGSQVTTIPLSFYNRHLSQRSMQPLNHLLEVEGANGQAVPYLGYVELTLKFPQEFLGTEAEVPTLALVVPDLTHMPQILIGTNTLDVLYADHAQAAKPIIKSHFHGYRAVIRVLEARLQQASSSILGQVKVKGGMPDVITAGSTVVLDGCVNIVGPLSETWVTVEPSASSSLPGGLLVASCLHTLPPKRNVQIPIVLRNETQVDLTIPPRAVLAELHAVQSVIEGRNPVSAPVYKGVNSAQAKIIPDFGDSPLPSEWKERITDLVNHMPDVFALHDLDYGHTDKVKHHINLSDNTPFKQRARPIHPQDVDAVRRHLKELLDAGVIRESESPFASPIVVVKKKNNDVRLCIDFRKLNSQTIKDAYALPNLEEAFSVLSGSKWFSVLDLKSGFYQIEMEEADKQKTAFVCPLGFYEFNRMPQGVTNAPSTFQRLMERCMGDLNRKEALVFIDDLIIFSKTLEEHEARLLQVLKRLREYGLKLSPKKCKFFQTSVRYLGHIVSQNGVETDPTKIEALKTWPRPRNLKELKSFIGFSGYYRRFVQDFSKITKPLNDLTVGYPPLQKNQRKKLKESIEYRDPKEQFGDRWTQECQRAFDSIIEKLTSAPVLGFANPSLPYVLTTDASTTGLGAALYQEQEGRMRVIAFASRGLTKSETKYPAHKLEFLALKWAVTAKFSDYLYGGEFTVITDSNPLTYILTSAKLDATSYRWLSSLSTFNFKIQYRAGKRNLDADALSRRPHDRPVDDFISQKECERIKQFTLHHLADTEQQTILPKAVKALCERHQVYHRCDYSNLPCFQPTLFESLSLSASAVPQEFQQEDAHGLPTLPQMSEEELRECQRADPELKKVIKYLESGRKPEGKVEPAEIALWLREWNRFEFKNGVLFRRKQDRGSVIYQLALPVELRGKALRSLHHDMGHLGIERTLDLARARFYWPRMAMDVEEKIRTCERCVKRKTPPERAAPLVNISTSRPLELLCMDYLSLEPDRSNIKDILVITDHFTRYAVAIPTRNQKAQTVAKCLWDNFLVHYGDQGPDFESKLIKELCGIAGIRKVRTTPYHPRGNPVERFNRTLLQMLGTLNDKEKSCWKDFVKPLVHAYNCTRNDSTGFSPYELMFGRQPRLPIDLAFGLPADKAPPSHSSYVRNLKDRLEESYRVASENALKVARRNKKRFDERVVASSLEVGDRVLVRNVKLRGKHKLADKWEKEAYVVIKKAADLPVYTVQPEGEDGPLRTLHRDLLLPCGFLQETTPEKPLRPKTSRRPRTRANPGTQEPECMTENSESESDPVDYYSHGHLPSVETRVLSNSKPPKPLSGGLMAEVSPEMRNAVSTNTEQLTPVTSQRNLPDQPDVEEGSALDEPEREDTQMMDPVGMDVLSGIPVLDQESDGSPTGTSSGEDERNDALTRGGTINSPSSRDGSVENGESLEDVPRRSQRHREPPKRLQYPKLGNPLSLVVQSLFQGLSTAFTISLEESDTFKNTSLEMQAWKMQWDLHSFKAGRV